MKAIGKKAQCHLYNKQHFKKIKSSEMKRELESGSREEAVCNDVWEEVIFPFLYQESLSFWLTLSLVSRTWYEMISRNKTLALEENIIGSDDNELDMIVKRFGDSVVSLKARSSIIPHLDHTKFPCLRELFVSGGVFSYTINHIDKLTSLTLRDTTMVYGINELINLTHLSIINIRISSRNTTSQEIQSLKNIKHLCLCGFGYTITTSSLVPLDRSSLEYLESDDLKVFRDIGYSGDGKLVSNNPLILHRYEGQWKEGKRHGKGSISRDGDIVYGEWVDDWVTKGIVVNKNGDSYDGDLDDCNLKPFSSYEGLERCEWVAKHGYGVFSAVVDDTVERYEGYFENDERQGEGKLYKEGLLVYEGHWEQGDMFSLPIIK
jgi:hypothetical protein